MTRKGSSENEEHLSECFRPRLISLHVRPAARISLNRAKEAESPSLDYSSIPPSMSTRASMSPFTQCDRMIDTLYKLKYDVPFIPFRIVTKNKRRYLINRPQDIAFPPDRTGRMCVIWRDGKCAVLKFDEVSLLKPK